MDGGDAPRPGGNERRRDDARLLISVNETTIAGQNAEMLGRSLGPEAEQQHIARPHVVARDRGPKCLSAASASRSVPERSAQSGA